MKAQIKVLQGHKVLWTAVVTASPKAYENKIDPNEEFLEDLFNIERYVNTQGAYRMHVSDVEARNG